MKKFDNMQRKNIFLLSFCWIWVINFAWMNKNDYSSKNRFGDEWQYPRGDKYFYKKNVSNSAVEILYEQM